MAIAAYTKACAKNVGGCTALFLADVANVASVTITSGEITAISMNSTLKFHEADADIDSIVRTEEGTGNGNNISYAHKVAAKFAKPSKSLNTLRTSLADGSPCGILAIVADGNGVAWLVGYSAAEGFKRPLRLEKDSLNTGGSPADEGQNVSIELGAVNGYPAVPFDATNSGTIIGGTATFITYTT
jgi:hypothetical protein